MMVGPMAVGNQDSAGVYGRLLLGKMVSSPSPLPLPHRPVKSGGTLLTLEQGEGLLQVLVSLWI